MSSSSFCIFWKKFSLIFFCDMDISEIMFSKCESNCNVSFFKIHLYESELALISFEVEKSCEFCLITGSVLPTPFQTR